MNGGQCRAFGEVVPVAAKEAHKLFIAAREMPIARRAMRITPSRSPTLADNVSALRRGRSPNKYFEFLGGQKKDSGLRCISRFSGEACACSPMQRGASLSKSWGNSRTPAPNAPYMCATNVQNSGRLCASLVNAHSNKGRVLLVPPGLYGC